MKFAKFKEVLTKEYLTQEHLNNKKSVFKISKEVGCDPKTITNYLNIYQLDRQPTIYPNRKNSNHPLWKGYEEISSSYWNNLKNGAKTRKILFEIKIEDMWNLFLKQDRKCALSGLPISFDACKSNTASLDRINSLKPYIESNVQWVHRDVNFAKQSLNNDEFIYLCKQVSNHNS